MPILMYHKVAPVNRRSLVPGHYVPPGRFKRQMAALRLLGYSSVKLSTLFTERPQKRPIVLTFDDGYRNFLTNALPAMQANGMSGTVFLVSRQVGGTNAWDVIDGDIEEQLLSWDEISHAKSAGTEFGSHTLDHANLAKVDHDEAWRQIADSRSELSAALKEDVFTFCYPYGAKTPEVGRMVEKAGYRFACSVEKGVNSPHTDRYALRRINVRSDTLLPVFLMKLWRRQRGGP